MSDAPSTTAAVAPAPAPPGSRFEQAWILGRLLLDLASVPFHLVAFLCTLRGQRARLSADLAESRA